MDVRIRIRTPKRKPASFNMNFEDYFTDKAIKVSLFKSRAKLAIKRDKKHFYANISKNVKVKSNSNEVSDMLPPRSFWIRPRYREGLTPLKLIQKSLEITFQKIDSHRSEFETHIWYKKLKNFIFEVQHKALISTPRNFQIKRIIALEKDKKKKTFRPITEFSLLNKVIISQTALYLTDFFDDFFSNFSYAFRSPKNKSQNRTIAIENIIRFLKNNENKDLYIAECDIRKFYDTIDHKIIKESFSMLIRKAKDAGKVIDSRAIKIFDAYLDSYAFNFDVFFKQSDILKRQGVKKGTIEWLSEEEIAENSFSLRRAGIPQGGAISCFIANMVLDRIDSEIKEKLKKDAHYSRYCDDMVLISNSEDSCKEVFNLYLNNLKKLKLLPQPEKQFSRYGKDFWDSKDSKLPYYWTTDKSLGIPWLSFLGYQIHRTGRLRVRKSTIEKEIKKQVSIADKLIFSLAKKKGAERIIEIDSSAKRSSRSMIFRLKKKLLTMSVGKISNPNDIGYFLLDGQL